jgi:3-hydroxy-9,10-secoandrosta-1,3,5(10)-triene-9,17-dione monooxygenase
MDHLAPPPAAGQKQPASLPPEPDLTPAQMVARAVALRPRLIEEQAACEERTYYSEEMHAEFVGAGFYRLYVPRRYGGYEFDVPTFVRVVLELARGCPSTAWCMGLASGHALQIGSWWEERAQAEIFGDGDFRAASVAGPIGPATKVEDDVWLLNGKIGYASGIPYSTHYMGQAVMPGEDAQGLPRMLLFVAPRSEWTMLDDWGHLLGLKGSGSQSIVFENGRIPAHWALEETFMVDVDVSEGTHGLRLHDNPMYGGRAISCFTMSLGAVMVGAAYNALDEYETMMTTKTTPLPPMTPRKFDLDYQRYFGRAMAKIATAEAALLNAADQHMELCERFVDKGIPYSYADDQRVGCIAREVMIQAWETMQSDIFRTAGSSAGGKGERIERIYRDMSIGNSHRNTLLRDWAFREIAREKLGLPRDFERANVQQPRS